MTVYTNDPIRVHITLDDIWNMCHSKGIESCAYPTDQKDEFFIKFVCSDTNPYNQLEEKYKEDIDREIEKFKVVQDRIREFKPYTYFNSKNSIVKEAILDTKIFGKENRYDILLDKATGVHRLKNGQLFGIIENE
jgi:hypothetical protein